MSAEGLAKLFDLSVEVVESRFDGTPLEPITVTKMVAWLPFSTNMIRDLGPLPGDEEEYALRSKPHRGGILDERRLRDKRVTRERLIRDSEALRHALRWTVEDLVDNQTWGKEQAAEVRRLEAPDRRDLFVPDGRAAKRNLPPQRSSAANARADDMIEFKSVMHVNDRFPSPAFKHNDQKVKVGALGGGDGTPRPDLDRPRGAGVGTDRETQTGGLVAKASPIPTAGCVGLYL